MTSGREIALGGKRESSTLQTVRKLARYLSDASAPNLGTLTRSTFVQTAMTAPKALQTVVGTLRTVRLSPTCSKLTSLTSSAKLRSCCNERRSPRQSSVECCRVSSISTSQLESLLAMRKTTWRERRGRMKSTQAFESP